LSEGNYERSKADPALTLIIRKWRQIKAWTTKNGLCWRNQTNLPFCSLCYYYFY